MFKNLSQIIKTNIIVHKIFFLLIDMLKIKKLLIKIESRIPYVRGFLISSVSDPDPHGSALKLTPWILICIRDADSGSGSRSYKITET